MQIKSILVLIGTFWPVVGFSLAVFIGLLLDGWKRWLMLFAGPVLFLLPCFLYAGEIAFNGNMLFVALLGIMFVFTLVYYPVLTVTGIVLLIRKQKQSSERIE